MQLLCTLLPKAGPTWLFVKHPLLCLYLHIFCLYLHIHFASLYFSFFTSLSAREQYLDPYSKFIVLEDIALCNIVCALYVLQHLTGPSGPLLYAFICENSFMFMSIWFPSLCCVSGMDSTI